MNITYENVGLSYSEALQIQKQYFNWLSRLIIDLKNNIKKNHYKIANKFDIRIYSAPDGGIHLEIEYLPYKQIGIIDAKQVEQEYQKTFIYNPYSPNEIYEEIINNFTKIILGFKDSFEEQRRVEELYRKIKDKQAEIRLQQQQQQSQEGTEEVVTKVTTNPVSDKLEEARKIMEAQQQKGEEK